MWWLYTILGIAVFLTALWLFLIAPRLRRPDMSRLRCDYAHRGLHGDGIPENSLPAFDLAASHGYGIELDVQLSSDGVIMVFHDGTLIRMTGQEGKLCEYTCAELQSMHLGESGEVIPTFDQVLDTVGGRVPLLIELKGESAGGNAALCEKLAARLDGYAGDFCIESFNPMLLRWFKRNRPDIVRGQLVTNTLRERPEGNKTVNFLLAHLMTNVLSRPDFVSYNGKYAREWSLGLNLHLFRAVPFVWTVRDPSYWQTQHRRGICTIFEGFRPDRDGK